MRNYVEAALYILHGEDKVLWESLGANDNVRWSIDPDPAKPASLRRRDLVGTDALRPAALPPGMEDWRHETLHLGAERYWQTARPHRIAPELLETLPDIVGWQPMTIVTDRARQILDRLFPEGGLFFPLTILDPASGNEITTARWSWTQVHRIRFDSTGRPEAQQMPSTSSGPFGCNAATWEIFHNRAAQAFLVSLPYFGASASYKGGVFRADIFHALKDAGLTGLNVMTGDSYLTQEPQDTVFPLHFAPSAPSLRERLSARFRA